MVYILDGCSFHTAHIWSKSGIFNLMKSFGYINSRQIRFFQEKLPILHHRCAKCSELPSYISAMDIGEANFLTKFNYIYLMNLYIFRLRKSIIFLYTFTD